MSDAFRINILVVTSQLSDSVTGSSTLHSEHDVRRGIRGWIASSHIGDQS